ncbi:SAM-dependent methyltransferase [Papillibacter cinnamivorans]|uniref:tRNA-Thr(GGU) m(6)t(6)A37 methyltransferase TsaA n=1 Tax=Papillibacter cinnamivorans DSM 12816 TaxID=1122930 RepID=A0A1W1ZM54_9FIRM|nr:SAM-dependent methyltransferase [Papillibacter cinnamivorans]SMC49496.1 tRNA-Thr(GGU) m(6)t(6)A37 methyltransferase TsaA [Papillibacter cinnamivorans DSM 12816]
MSVIFNPIGKVKVESNRYYIELEEKYFEATLGLQEYSHIEVIWWFNLYDSEESRNYFVMDQPYKNGPEKVGVLASRSPVRPNPIAVTACALIALDGKASRLEVGYIDAEDGTPVLDIKPYEPSIDKVRDVRMPDWCKHWPDCLEANEGFDWSREFNFPE